MAYTKDYVPQAILDSMAVSHSFAIFFYLDTDPPLRLWAGVSDIPGSIDSIDPETDQVYLGAGRLLTIPELESLINGQSSSIQFGLAGIDPADASEVLANLPPVRGKALVIGFTTLDKYYQPLGKIIPIWYGTASHTGNIMPVVGYGEDRTVTIALAAVSGANTRSRPSLSMWSAAHQEAEYPGDKFCNQAARIAAGVAPAWPNYS